MDRNQPTSACCDLRENKALAQTKGELAGTPPLGPAAGASRPLRCW